MSQDEQHSGTSSDTHSGYITIGLLLPDHSHTDVIEAAEFAIQQANAEAAYKGKEFKLVIRTAEGFWGAGSKESVSLVYEDQVRAIVGALDGRNGHLAEQVATKSHLSYIETFATEATLSQAFVPWFMRVVPNDNQQSATIVNQIRREGAGKIGILSTQDYDTRYAVRSLTKAVAARTSMAPLVIELDTTNIHEEALLKNILSRDLDHLVIPFDADYLKNLICTLRAEKPALKIYGTLHFTMGVESRKSGWDTYEGVFMVSPLFDRAKYPALPDSRSAYMYDAINLVVQAIRQAGTDRVSITDFISDSEHPSAITGSISFDELGNRLGASTLIRIRNGKPELIKQP
ncbi:MAG: ABC transporter substrate-binding protein [Bacteroidota bacterium]|nr:ABC transporter substrate-binding protein [Bacteroidota bacterium]